MTKHDQCAGWRCRQLPGSRLRGQLRPLPCGASHAREQAIFSVFQASLPLHGGSMTCAGDCCHSQGDKFLLPGLAPGILAAQHLTGDGR